MKDFTDNKGNTFALLKGVSNKYPLTILLMELAEELRSKDLSMDLEWVRRDENTVVDDLSNGKYEAFDQSLRRGQGRQDGVESFGRPAEKKRRTTLRGYQVPEASGEERRCSKKHCSRRSTRGKVLSRWWVTEKGTCPS